MTTPQSDGQQLDLRPFEIYAPVPPMLAQACGYAGQVFGHPLNARYVGFYWERSGDETNFYDGQSSGTGEYTGFQAFVDHPKVAVHLRHCDFGSSETLPRHYLLLDRTEQSLYALPVRLAQQFLHMQWPTQSQASEKGSVLQVESVGDLLSALDLSTWQEMTPPGDINARVIAAGQHQSQLIHDLIAWLNKQQKPVTSERIAEYQAPAYAMLLRHVMEEGAFAQAGELVHLQEVREIAPNQITVTFYRENGIDGPDGEHLFSVSGAWADIVETLEPLLEPAQLDDLLDSKGDLSQVFGRYAAWNGYAFPIVPMLDTLAIRVSLPCARCGRNPMTAYARSGLHRGAFCYVYDALGNYQANLRDQEYVCPRCEKPHSGNGVAGDAQDQEDAS
jgi:hypothetical protein